MCKINATLQKAITSSPLISSFFENDGYSVFNSPEYVVLPGFCDVHVHFREPGFLYKETIKTGSMAAAHGGYTAVCTMPNLNPVPDSKENLNIQLEAIKKDAIIKIYPYASITQGQLGEKLSDMDSLKDDCIAFSDDGRGVQNDNMMREAMLKAKSLGKIIVAHCEVNELLRGGYIHDGVYAAEHNHKGICSASEYEQVARDIALTKETGASYHVCHISTKESVELIRNAKREGVDITCETAPHYLALDESMLKEDGKWKMNPPLRSFADRKALVEGIVDGTIDMIATDHAPHSKEEKSRGLEKSANGIVGLETAFSVMYSNFVKTGIITLDRLVELMSVNPAKRFGIDLSNDFSIWNLEDEFTVNPDEFLSMGKATPFENQKLFARCKLTVCKGNTVYKA